MKKQSFKEVAKIEYNEQAVLTVENLNVVYTKNNVRLNALKNLSFSLKKGEILALLGESGSGKSTCAKALLGLLPLSASIESGTLRLKGEKPLRLGDRAIFWQKYRGRRIAMIYQDSRLALNPVETIGSHFRRTMLFHKMGTREQIQNKSINTLKLLNFKDPEHILKCYPFELSGGMCQRVYTALVLCLDPEIIIADEPTSALDSVSQNEVLSLLKQVQKQFELSLILITHDIAAAYEISDRVMVLKNGSLKEEGRTQEVLLNPKNDYTKELIGARYLSLNREGKQKLISDTLLKIENISKTYEKKKERQKALDCLSLSLNKGETMGLLGFSGCGKSTLAKCITGLEAIDEGNIYYKEREISHLGKKERRQLCSSLQIVFQDARASLNPSRSAVQLVKEPLEYMGIGSKSEREKKARRYLYEVGIYDEAQDRRPMQLSTGQCQRVAIARALVVEPDLLICDEAVSALDMILQKQILCLLKRLQELWGFAVLMISHDIRVIRYFCQSTAVMMDGKILEKLPSEKLYESRNDCTRKLLENETCINRIGGHDEQQNK